MRRWLAWLGAGVVWLAGVEARGAVLDASSTTLLQGRQEMGEEQARTVVPIIEMVGLDARRIGLGGWGELSAHLDAWGRVDPVAPTSPQFGNAADVNLLYLTGVFADRHLQLELGRHFVYGGAARSTQLDGLSGEWRIWRGLGVSAFGGLPVIPRFAVARGDAIAGGRAFYRYSIDAEVGASFLQLWDHSQTARQEAALDARWVPIRSLTLSGFAGYATTDLRLSEADLAVLWQPHKLVPGLQLTLDARRTAPDLFISRTSIFSVFAAEQRDEFGGEVLYRFKVPLRLWADYHALRIEGQPGTDAGLRGEYGFFARSTAGVQVRYLQAPLNSYWQGRLYGTARFLETLLFSLNLDAFRFGEPINGQRNSFVGSLSAGYGFAPGWSANVTGLASVTPFFEQRFELVAKLVWQPSFRVHEVSP